MTESVRDYLDKWRAELSPEKRDAVDKKNSEFFAGACCDDYPCECEERE